MFIHDAETAVNHHSELSNRSNENDPLSIRSNITTRVQPRHTRKNTGVIRPYPDSGFLMARVPRRVSILQQDKVSRKKINNDINARARMLDWRWEGSIYRTLYTVVPRVKYINTLMYK